MRRLVFLGDLIDRGASSAGVLRLWARNAAAWNVDRNDRVIGNHEQLLLLAMTDAPHKEKATNMWLSEAIGGSTFFKEMMELPFLYSRRLDFKLFSQSLGAEILHLFTTQRTQVPTGNLILVHAGLDPARDRVDFLSQPWT